MQYRVTHTTDYAYADVVSLCYNEAYLKPRATPQQSCQYSHLSIQPEPAVIQERSDFFGNTSNYFSIQTAHQELTVTAVSEVTLELELDLVTSVTASDTQAWQAVRDQVAHAIDDAGIEARSLVLPSPFVALNAELTAYAQPSFSADQSLVAAVRDLNSRIFHDFTYDPNFTTIVTPLSDVFKHRRGVCQDFAHLAIACIRAMGLAARYVSGYLETLPPPGQIKLRGADASHAWFAVYLPGYGWIDFDPTNNQQPSGQHITTAWGRDFGDVTPLKGIIFGGGEHELEVSVDVERL